MGSRLPATSSKEGTSASGPCRRLSSRAMLVTSASEMPHGKVCAIGREPHSGSSRDAPGTQSVLGNEPDNGFLYSAHIIDNADTALQEDNRVADKLTRAMPGDFTAPVHRNDRGAVERISLLAGASSGCVDGIMFDVNDCVGALVGGHLSVHLALMRPALVVFSAGGTAICNPQVLEV